MNDLGNFVSKSLLCLVDCGIGKLCILVDLIHLKERKELHALDNVSVINVSPVLVEVEYRCLLRIEPYSTLCCLTHLLAFAVCKERECKAVNGFALLAAYKFHTCEDVGPLVVTTELQVAAIVLMEIVEVITLHEHIVEFEEGQTLLKTLLVALCSEHLVYGEVCTDFS